MPIKVSEFTSSLQRFSDLVNNKSPKKGDIALLGKGNNVDQSSGKSDAFGRLFCLTKSSVQSCKVNNQIRAEFLAAISEEFQGFDKIPDSVKKALNLKAYDLATDSNGDQFVRSGKPLTQRRIKQVIEAVRSALEELTPEELSDEKFRVKDIYSACDSGKVHTRAESVIYGAFRGNEDLVTAEGTVTYLGTMLMLQGCVQNRLDAQIDKAMSSPSVLRRNLRAYEAGLRNAAKAVNGFAKGAKEMIQQFFNTPEGRHLLPDDDRAAEATKDFVLPHLIGKVANDFCSKPDDSVDDMLKKFTAWIVSKEGKDVIAGTLEAQKYRVQVLFQFESQFNQKWATGNRPWGTGTPLQRIRDAVKELLQDHNYAPDVATTDAKSIRVGGELNDIFEIAMEECNHDVDKATNLFCRLMRTMVAKPHFVKVAKAMVKEFGSHRFDFPSENTAENVHAFLLGLWSKLKTPFTRFAAELVEDGKKKNKVIGMDVSLGADDFDQLYAAFAQFLLDASPEFKQWAESLRRDVLLGVSLISDSESQNSAESLDAQSQDKQHAFFAAQDKKHAHIAASCISQGIYKIRASVLPPSEEQS